MPDRTLERPGAALALSTEGDGPPVVALHGLTSSRRAEDAGGFFGWHEVARAGRRLLRYDARGHGASTGRANPDDYRWDHLADDLLAVLDLVSPGAPVDAVGVSMGVGTLLTAAVRDPGRFGRLALVLPPTAWETRIAQADQYRAAADAVERIGLERVVAAMAAMPALPLLEAGGWILPAPDVGEALLPSAFRGAAKSDLPAPDAIAALPHEVLLAPWVGDPGHPVSTAERLHALLPTSALDVVRAPDDLRGLGSRVARFLG